MRFNTNLYEARQYWIQNLNEQGIPHGSNLALTWIGGVDGYWVSKSGAMAGEIGGPPPKFTSQQYWDDAVKRDARTIARRAANVVTTPAGGVVSKLGRLLARIGSKALGPIGLLSLAGEAQAGEVDYDWGAHYKEIEAHDVEKVSGAGISDEDLAIQQGIEDGTYDSGGNLPMGPRQANMYTESYKNRNYSCLREQFYGF